ncbi:MAG: VWA domain-containing protein [Gemmataceae bacterium]
MTLLTPVWLILAVPLTVALVVWRPPTRLLLALRIVSALLVLLALAGLSLRLPSRAGTVVVVADRSLSMPAEGLPQQKEVVDIIHKAMSSDDRLAVVSFGQQALVEKAPSSAPFRGFEHVVGGNASNLAEAIDLGLSLIPDGSPGRMLVLSDGQWTGRDPLLLTSSAVARGIAIDYRIQERAGTGDLAVARVDAPSTVSAGESFLLTGWVSAPSSQQIQFVLKRGEQVIAEGQRAVTSGMNRLAFRDRAVQRGNQSYRLEIRPVGDDKQGDTDPVPENNSARFMVGVGGPRPILHVTEAANSGLARLLTRGGLDLVVARPNSVSWTLDHLSRYSAVVLENVPAERVGHLGMETLAAWVRETGSGLLMTGGRSSYGPGGYYKSPLEPILPVSMELRNEHRKLSLAIVVALDRSGSMAVPVAGGKVKMDLANLGAVQVLDIMGPLDEFGCIAVDSMVHPIAPLARVDDRDKGATRSKILGIQSMGGGIFVYEALAAASQMLLNAKAGTKHIILFSDAADSEEPGAYKDLMEKCNKAGITVSVIGLGTERDVDAELLKDIAKRGKGRVFFTDKPEELPRLFAQDTFVVARNTFLEEPVKIRHMPGLTTMMEQSLPSPAGLGLGGYNLCYLRPGATIGTITLDEYKAPVVASWRAGSGRVVCYTGEADGKFAGAMAQWEHAGEYFTSLARWVAGAANPLRDNMLLTQEIRDGVNVVTLHLDPERRSEPFAGLPRVSTLRSLPDEAPRTEKAVLRWTGADQLSLDVALDGGEMTLSTVEVPGYDAVSLPPVCMPYSPEFKPAQKGRGLVTLEKLGRGTGGEERVALAGIWGALPRQVRYIPVARWLLLAAVVLWLLEVLERRTSLLTSWRRQPASDEAFTPEPRVAPVPRQASTARTKTPARAPASTQAAAQPVPTPAAPTTPASPLLPNEPDGIMEALRKARKRARGRTD